MEKLRIALLSLAYAGFWALFVLFPYPSMVVPGVYAVGPAFYSSAVMLAVAILAAAVLVVLRDRAVRWATTPVAAPAIASALFLGCGAVLICISLAGEPPLWMVAAYPVAVATYGMVLALALVDESMRLTARDNAVVLALSLLLSFLLGLALASLTESLPVGDISSFLMLVLSGACLAVLGCLRRGSRGAVVLLPRGISGAKTALSGRSAVLIAVIILCYLLGSGAFMSLSSVARGETWFSDGWIHCAIGLVLYLTFCLYALRGWRRGRASYPWVAFFVLSIACLYGTALFYSSVALLCRGVILPSRPMAIVLLWAVVLQGMKTSQSSWWLPAAVAPLSIFAVDCVIHAIGFVGLASEQMDSVVNAIMLATAFVMTLGMLPLVRLRSASDLRVSETKGGDVSAFLAALASDRGLSEREAQVLELLYRGNTQKKIAESLFLSVSSVQTYAKNLYRKLDVHSRQELIDMVNAFAQESGRTR